ncbi:LuxR C-terminal-related transcriptional regulator [Herbivorax sp. ANBcel31]|uniref:LuxR C-terminal-related transcriptional regulator n=1 Tax=Herbivorax sp. ANBcel31 TaxID=3069754 RepID=UPI0027B7F666|nr:LuxR C-terminal-related transcriptional regulator [Herbivorax sp. ANBcel31]MDQ2087990.1 LuxR C-terminal-related transcriptional regulator [Herbivorax sp. ANBcel31]
MQNNLLKIKTTIPPISSNVLMRKHLLDQISEDLLQNNCFTKPITLFSSPAGSGKTTAIRSFLSNQQINAAWYSIDSEDNYPQKFWMYLITSLKELSNEIGSISLELLKSNDFSEGGKVDFKNILYPFLNELFSINKLTYLVLDDYHLITNPEINKDMIFFIENLPSSVHILVSTRSDPPWPLTRWRAKGKLSEIRINNLKFSLEEFKVFFKEQKKGVELKKEHIEKLYNKTEGWISGLILAALSIYNLKDSIEYEKFIDNFSGSNRHIIHFLGEEVYKSQPEHIKQFLLKTSILKHFCAPLCDLITNRQDSCEIIESLERENMFIIPLDANGEWYRYHNLFSDLLVFHLKKNYPAEYKNLHGKASEWFLKQDEPSEAIYHAYYSDNLEKTAYIFHEKLDKLLTLEGPGFLIKCMELYSLDLLKKYPRLLAIYIFFILVVKSNKSVGNLLEEADKIGYDNPIEHQEYLGMLSSIKTYYYIFNNEFSKATQSAEDALSKLSDKNNFWRMGISIFLGDVKLFSGYPKQAYSYYFEAHLNNKSTGSNYFCVSSGIKVSIALNYLGKLNDSKKFAKDTLVLAQYLGYSNLTKIGTLWGLLGDILREQGNLEEAKQFVEKGIIVSQKDLIFIAWNYIYKISISFSNKDYNDCMACILFIENISKTEKFPVFINIILALWKSKIYIQQGELLKAENLLLSIGVSQEMEISEGKEKGFLLLARLLLVKDNVKYQCIFNILDQIEEKVSKNEYVPLHIETLILKSYLEYNTCNLQNCYSLISKALDLGNKNGFFQIFVDEGERLAKILMSFADNVNNNNDIASFSNSIVEAVVPTPKNCNDSFEEYNNSNYNASNLSSEYVELTEDLTKRELEILELISEGMSNQDICQKLYLSVGTVKWHTSNIYSKLGVRGRTEAIALARKLKIL